jgi:predicted site-specific integrase-resolvase
MKLSDYAKQTGVSYRTAWRWWKAGKLSGYQTASGTIIVQEHATDSPMPSRVVIYTRVSSSEHRSNLDSQAERLVAYCEARGYPIHKIVKEVGSGVNDNRPKLLSLLADTSVSLLVVEHKDRLTRFGFRSIETLLSTQGRSIEVVNQADNGTEDLLADLTAIIYSFCARLYGLRRAKRKTERITQELLDGNHDTG